MLDDNNLDREVRLEVASADDTPAGVLEKLSQDPDSKVRRAVAGNPNTPIAILEKLGKEFPEAITDNPIFSLLLLENPDGEFVRLSIAQSSAKLKDILLAIATNKNNDLFPAYQTLDRYLRTLLAEYPNTFFLILEKSADIKDVDIQRVVDKVFMKAIKKRNTQLEILKNVASY
jgi:hypothetical protein